jgi:hypothetical protein
MGRIHRNLNVFGGNDIQLLDVLFDSGASQSVIDKQVADKICVPIPLPKPIVVILPNNGRKEITHTCAFHTSIDDSQISDTALIMENLGEVDMVIGVQTMRRYGMQLEFDDDHDSIRITKRYDKIFLF